MCGYTKVVREVHKVVVTVESFSAALIRSAHSWPAPCFKISLPVSVIYGKPSMQTIGIICTTGSYINNIIRRAFIASSGYSNNGMPSHICRGAFV